MVSQKAIVSGISGRYALALFDLACESKTLDAVESDLAKLSALLVESADFKDLVSSPVYNRDQQVAGVAAIGAEVSLSDTATKFLGVLATNRRLGSLGFVIRDFGLLLASHRGEMTADVTSAKKLTATQLKELKKKLKSAVGRDVDINSVVDADLLGGLVVKVGSRMIDSSVKTKLDNLAIAMKGVQ